MTSNHNRSHTNTYTKTNKHIITYHNTPNNTHAHRNITHSNTKKIIKICYLMIINPTCTFKSARDMKDSIITIPFLVQRYLTT